jgi:hypothetical protein
VVDQGLDRNKLGATYGGGWPVGSKLPGTTAHDPDTIRRPHGMMIAQNILRAAPDVTLFDMPLVPPQVANIQPFLYDAEAAYLQMLLDISIHGGGPWILVNPWAVFDTRTDLPPPHDYCGNSTHLFNLEIKHAVASNIFIVFAAGNCGQFCPDIRCGPADRGPRHSIHGANSLKEVLTAGAVRADKMWLGYSSQGPGHIDPDKPDLCAPSQFRDSDDAFKINTGTSAACALATGVAAGLLGKWPTMSPQEVKDLLTSTATAVRLPSGRVGSGILNAEAAYDKKNAGP